MGDGSNDSYVIRNQVNVDDQNYANWKCLHGRQRHRDGIIYGLSDNLRDPTGSFFITYKYHTSIAVMADISSDKILDRHSGEVSYACRCALVGMGFLSASYLGYTRR